jgi:alpha-glucosidase
MFGDSLTEGWNEESSLSKSNCKISGNPGFTTSHFIWVINDQVLKYHPDTCYILGGVNDVGVGIPLARTFKNYKTIIDTLKKTHIVPIVQSTIFTLKSDADNNKIDSLNNFLITLCKQEDIRFIDLNKKMSINKKLNKNFSKDLVHLNTLGYQTWAAIIN